MQNPLVTLDEIIWKQFEKVTIKANKSLGWNKYDLARITNTAANLAYTTYGVYELLYGLGNNSLLDMTVGGVVIPLGYILNKRNQKILNKDEEIEVRYIERNGAPMQPLYDPFRPTIGILGLFPIVMGIRNIVYGVPKVSSKNNT